MDTNSRMSQLSIKDEPKITESILAECRDVFSCFDSKGDEKISVRQIGDALRALSQNPTEAQIKSFSSRWPDPETRISFEEFLPIYQDNNKNGEKYTPEHLVEGLSHFDREGNGFISIAELRHILTSLGEKLTEEEADQLVSGHEDSNGNINIADFVRTITS